MARYRRKKSKSTISGTIKRYLLGILFVGLSGVIMGLTTYIASIIPQTNFSIGDVQISNTLFINFIGFAVGIVVMLSAIRKFGVRL